MADLARITADPTLMVGKPVVRGTRITVEHLIEELAAGATFDQLVDAHPELTREDLKAALTFALEAVRLGRIGNVAW